MPTPTTMNEPFLQFDIKPSAQIYNAKIIPPILDAFSRLCASFRDAEFTNSLFEMLEAPVIITVDAEDQNEYQLWEATRIGDGLPEGGYWVGTIYSGWSSGFTQGIYVYDDPDGLSAAFVGQ